MPDFAAKKIFYGSQLSFHCWISVHFSRSLSLRLAASRGHYSWPRRCRIVRISFLGNESPTVPPPNENPLGHSIEWASHVFHNMVLYCVIRNTKMLIHSVSLFVNKNKKKKNELIAYNGIQKRNWQTRKQIHSDRHRWIRWTALLFGLNHDKHFVGSLIIYRAANTTREREQKHRWRGSLERPLNESWKFWYFQIESTYGELFALRVIYQVFTFGK